MFKFIIRLLLPNFMAKCPRCKSKDVEHKAVVVNPSTEDDIRDKYQCKKCHKMFIS